MKSVHSIRNICLLDISGVVSYLRSCESNDGLDFNHEGKFLMC